MIAPDANSQMHVCFCARRLLVGSISIIFWAKPLFGGIDVIPDFYQYSSAS